MGVLLHRNIANFEVFCWNISLSTNFLFRNSKVKVGIYMKIESLGTQSRIFKWNHLWLMLILQFDGKCCSLLQCKINVPNAITNITKITTNTSSTAPVSLVCLYCYLSHICQLPVVPVNLWFPRISKETMNSFGYATSSHVLIPNLHTLSFFMISLASFIWIGIIIFKFLSNIVLEK